MIRGIEEGRIKEIYTDDGGYFRTKNDLPTSVREIEIHLRNRAIY